MAQRCSDNRGPTVLVSYQEHFDSHNVHSALQHFLGDTVLSERKGKKGVCICCVIVCACIHILHLVGQW